MSTTNVLLLCGGGVCLLAQVCIIAYGIHLERKRRRYDD
jgi:hypothetical protein